MVPAILGPIVWSLTGTEHRRAFILPISDLIELENLQFFQLLVPTKKRSSEGRAQAPYRLASRWSHPQ